MLLQQQRQQETLSPPPQGRRLFSLRRRGGTTTAHKEEGFIVTKVMYGLFTMVELLVRLAIACRSYSGAIAGLTTMQILYKEMRSAKAKALVVPDSLKREYFKEKRLMPNTKIVFVIRHGESEWNVAQKAKNVVKMFGRFDHGLTAEGASQAERLRLALRSGRRSEAGTEFAEAQTIYCSPLARAVHTALIALAGHQALRDSRFELNEDLRELCFPLAGFDSMTSVPVELSMKRAREAIGPRLLLPIERRQRLLDDDDGAPFVVGESRKTASARLLHFVYHTLCRDDQTAIVVGHSLFFKALVNNFADAATKTRSLDAGRLSRDKLPNAGVARLVFNCSKPRYPIIQVDQCFNTS